MREKARYDSYFFQTVRTIISASTCASHVAVLRFSTLSLLGLCTLAFSLAFLLCRCLFSNL